jgi:hypothetical protein
MKNSGPTGHQVIYTIITVAAGGSVSGPESHPSLRRR